MAFFDSRGTDVGCLLEVFGGQTYLSVRLVVSAESL